MKCLKACGALINNAYQNGNFDDVQVLLHQLKDYLVKEQKFTTSNANNILENLQILLLIQRGYDKYWNSEINAEIRFSKNSSQEVIDCADEIIKRIKMLPPELRNLLHSMCFYDTLDPENLYFEDEYDIPDFRSAASAGFGLINFWTTDLSSINMRTLAHELAHLYDTAYAYLLGVRRISKSAEWKDAMQKDLAYNGKEGVTEYAISTSSIEDFAESVSFFYYDPSILDFYPNRKKILERVLPKRTVTMGEIYDEAMKTIPKSKNAFENFLSSGDYNYFNSNSAIRDSMSQFSVEEWQAFYNYRTSHLNEIYDTCIMRLVKKGYVEPYTLLTAYIRTGNAELIDSDPNIMQSVASYSLQEWNEILYPYGQISSFKTPARSTVVYLDERGNEVSKEEGVRVHITEFDENDKIINEMGGDCTSILE